jgi:NhaC family Na+:H+ antiporter
MSFRKIAAFPTILAGALVGGLIAILLLQPVANWAKSDKSVVAVTGLTSISMNIVAGDQYMSIVLPGRMYRELYEERGIAPETLSRELEDTGTITSPLVPWISCGSYMAASLGIATIAYFPYCFFNLINVAISFVYALLGFQIRHIEPAAELAPPPEQVTLYGIGNRRAEPTTPEPAKPG